MAALVACAAYAAWASGTERFTAAAYASVAIPGALLLVALVATWYSPAPVPWQPLPAVRPTVGDTGVPWVALLLVIVGTELASYFHGGPRSLYPTISSSLEDAFRSRLVDAAAFVGWLAGGWYLVRR